jgi:hypothetical protein
MIRKKNLLILSVLLYFPLAGFIFNYDEPEGKAPVNGFIDITVESNVNRLFFSYPLERTGMYDVGKSVNTTGETVNIIVPVRDFRCSNATAFRDFLTLLKADQYPELSITVPRDYLIQYPQNGQLTIHDVIINIAGVSKKYDIACRVEARNSKDIILIGTVKIRLTDLEIDPPVKYFGLVKIKDEVIVKFGFSFKDHSLAINNNSD